MHLFEPPLFLGSCLFVSAIDYIFSKNIFCIYFRINLLIFIVKLNIGDKQLRVFKKFLICSYATSLWVAMSCSVFSQEPIRVLSWNIENFHHVDAYSYRGAIGTWRSDGDLRLVERIVANNYDLIFLQEASGKLATSVLVGPAYAVLSTEEYEATIDSAPTTDTDVYPFIAVARHHGPRLLSSKSFTLSAADDPASQSRDLQLIIVEGLGVKTGLLHVHLEHSCATTLESTRAACRRMNAEFRLIGEIVADRVDEVDNFIILGDFNRALLDPRLAGWRETSAPWIADLIPVPPCTLRPSSEIIDFIAIAKLSPEISIAYIEPTFFNLAALAKPQRISDHCPIAFQLIRPPSAQENE